MREIDEAWFPKLRLSGFRVTSPMTDAYNCIAWAANDTSHAWWPVQAEGWYWPSEAPMEQTVAAFVVAYGTRNFVPCDNPAPEKGFEKIAIYSDAHGSPLHAARQLASGRWTSKLGPMWDIEHMTLDAVEGPEYGTVCCYLKRPIAVPATTAD